MMRSRAQTMIKNLLKRCFVLSPLKGMECIGQFTVSVLNMDDEKTNVNSLGHCRITNARFIAMDGLVSVFKVIFRQCIAYKEKKESTKNINPRRRWKMVDESGFDDTASGPSPLLIMMEKLHQILMEWESEDTQLMSRIYALLPEPRPLYSRKPQCLLKSLEKLLIALPQPSALNVDADDAFDIKENAIS